MNFSPQSRVWIYQSNRRLNDQEVIEIEQSLNNFTSQWKAHGYPLKAKAEVLHHHFAILIVDETETEAQVSGCSTSASQSVIEELGRKYNVDFFDRYQMAYKKGNEVYTVGKADFETLISSKQIDLNTTVFNNLVQTLDELNNKWEVAIKNSWHKNIFAEQLNA